jgi:N-acyl-phosphatidylethanolamine-hydrolysing phospholipase D
VEEALRIHGDVGAKRSLGIHWGVFNLTDEALDEPPRKLAELRNAQGMPDDEFFVMAVGETRRLVPRAG